MGKAPVNKKLNKKEKQRQNREKKKQRVEAGDEVAGILQIDPDQANHCNL